MKYGIRRRLTATEREKLALHSDILAHLLFHRGITSEERAGEFLRPDYDAGLHDPFELKDAEKAAERIIEAIQAGRKIAIYADYDADGIPGAAVFNDFFRRIGFSNFVIYIPHRHDEGFGLNEGAVAELATAGVQLIITIDCGITDVLPVARANQLGLDVIITDHHEPPLELPQAYAIVDHKQGGCPYPDKDLCGSGVAYKLIQAILKKNRFGLKDGMEKWLLDLVGMATLSDMVPLVGENRVLARYGLDVLRKSRRRGLMRLFDKLKIPQKHISEDDIAFMITPRINAASRMGVPMDAFRLLAAETDDEAHMYADHLDAVNNERKGVVASLVKEVKNIVKERHGSAIPSVIVLGNPAWRPSLLGLAAHSCAEEFRRPVFLWGRDGDNAIKGSCRSEGDSNVVEIMRAVPAGIFEQFGGHRHSGGFTVANDAVHYLEQKLNEAAEGNIIRNSGLKPEENADDMVDAEMKFADITADLFNDIHQLAPFGVGNPKPVFLFRNVAPLRVRTFGKSGDHVELVFKSAAAGFGGAISAISFFGAASDWAANVKANQPVDLVASLEKSLFRGRAELRLRIVDVEVC